jgi:dolichyl-phosphate-mannose--protein O-mannosyl transferase
MEGVQIRHVKTGKILTVTDKKYPDEDWGQGMREVAGANPRVGNNKWKVEFNRVPNYGRKR